jgi:exopolyphosphatase/guanosine-5'-triphosphate,3'-diphosphate pyrophosphatase
VAEVQDDGSFRDIDVFADTVRLGAGLVSSGMIDPERAERAVMSLTMYQARAEHLGATVFLGVATAALRRATNGQEVLAPVARRTRWQVKVVSGDLEARLTWSGLRHLFPATGDFLLVDIGGGSSEALAIRDGQVIASESNDIGSGVLADQAFTRYPPGKEVDVAVDQARTMLAGSPVLAKVSEPGLVLSGGNGTFLRALTQWAETEETFTPTGLRKLMYRIADQDPAAIASYLGIAEERAQVIPAGAAIAVAIADIVQPTSLNAVPSGMLAGMVHEWLAGTW